MLLCKQFKQIEDLKVQGESYLDEVVVAVVWFLKLILSELNRKLVYSCSRWVPKAHAQ